MKYQNKEHYNIFFDHSDSHETLTEAQCLEYEKKLGFEESHKKILSLLIKIDKICRENNIKYSIADGTLLGAFRHKGFVPWDDDGDIMFVRSEYEKFVSACKKYNDVVMYRYFFLNKFTSTEFYNENLCVDIFITDVIPDNPAVFSSQLRKLKYLRYYLYPKLIIKQEGFLSKMSFLVSFIIGKIYGSLISDLDTHFDRIAKIGETNPSDTMARFNASFHELKYRFAKEWYDEYSEIDFCHYSFMCIKGGEDFLYNMYGDYKKLPPEEKRGGTHETPYNVDVNKKYFRFICRPEKLL